jgi:hypothetical protein
MVLDFNSVDVVADTIAGYPFDTVKVCLQTQTLSYRLYFSSLDYFIKIAKQELILGLYTNVWCWNIKWNCFFSIQSLSKNLFNDPDIYFALAITGGIADCTQLLYVHLLNLLKTRLQMPDTEQQKKLFILLKHSYKEPIECLKKSYKRRDIQHEIMCGLSMTFAQNIPPSAAYFLAWKFFLTNFLQEVKKLICLFI